MNFPERIKQHKAQSDSFAVLLYKLKDVGIFRNVTDNDYGIDFEIEIVHENQVIGNYIKAQVKAADNLKILKDGSASINGIKQSTLWYWAELSYRSHVLVFAVDLTTEAVYFSDSIFWQATKLLDRTKRSKSIKCRTKVDLTEMFKDKPNELKQIQTENFLLSLLVKRVAFSSSIPEILSAHRIFLRQVLEIFELYADTWHYDAWTEVQRIDAFATFLDCAKILLQELPKDIPEEFATLNEDDKVHIFSFDYWSEKTNWDDGQVSNQIAQTPLKLLMPLVLKRASIFSNRVLEAKYYWRNRDLQYLKLVFSITLPTDCSHRNLTDYGYNTHSHLLRNQKSFSVFLHTS